MQPVHPRVAGAREARAVQSERARRECGSGGSDPKVPALRTLSLNLYLRALTGKEASRPWGPPGDRSSGRRATVHEGQRRGPLTVRPRVSRTVGAWFHCTSGRAKTAPRKRGTLRILKFVASSLRRRAILSYVSLPFKSKIWLRSEP